MRSNVFIRISSWLIWFACVGRQEAITIKVACVSCKDPQQFIGEVGEDLIVKYAIKPVIELHYFKIAYEGKSKERNRIEINYIGDKIKPIKEGTRLSIHKNFAQDKKIGNGSITIKLKALTLNDNETEFTYDGTDSNGEKFYPPKNVVTVILKPKQTSGPDPNKSGPPNIIIIVVIVAVVLLFGAILALLIKKRILTTACCNKTKNEKEREVKGSRESVPLGPQEEKLYDAPQNQENINVQPQTEYAVLGPNGGRVGERNQKPIKPSVYAKVNTEDGFYPDLNYAEPRPTHT